MYRVINKEIYYDIQYNRENGKDVTSLEKYINQWAGVGLELISCNLVNTHSFSASYELIFKVNGG